MFIVNDRSTATAFSLLMAGTVSSSQSTLLTDKRQAVQPIPQGSSSSSSYDPTVSLEMSTGKLCCHYVPSFCHVFQAAWHHNSKSTQGKPEQLCRRIFAEAREAGASQQEQQNSIQCTAPSDASVLQGNGLVTSHTRLKCAKTCESYFSSIIVERYSYLRDNRNEKTK